MKVLAQETISFQGLDFYRDVTEAVIAWRQAARNDRDRFWQLPQAQRLSDVIKNHTGLSVDCIECPTNYRTDIAIYCPIIRNGHIFEASWGDFYSASRAGRKVEDLFKKHKQGFAKGVVDMRKNRVSGFFTDLPFGLIVDYHHLTSGRYTEREIAAGVLHEIGHAFTSCEYIARTCLTNQVLATIAKELDASPQQPMHVVLLRAVDSKRLTTEQYEAVKNAQDMQQCVVYAYGDAIRESIADLGASVYDTTSCEQLADQYATRCGAGRELVTSLEKTYKYNGYDDGMTKTSRIIRQIWECSMTILGAGIVGAGLVGLAAVGPATMALAGMITAYAATHLGTVGMLKEARLGMYRTYDSPAARLQRIEQDMIAQLKDQQIPDRVVKEVLESLKEVEEALERVQAAGYADRTSNLSHYVGLILSNTYRKRYDAEMLQKQIEQIAANPLFVQAAKLRTL